MLRIAAIILFIFFATSCKKAIKDVQEDLVVRAMTDGKWNVTTFTLNGATITQDLSAYKFQYHSNRTVDAIKNGVVEKTGQWSGDASAMTTWANFLGAPYPLTLLNGTWNILRTGWTYVEAKQVSATENKWMRLDKQ